MPFRLERHAFADTELKHGGVGAHFLEELEACQDAVVQIDQFGFGQLVDIDRGYWK